MKILIVDDSKAMQTIVRRAVEQIGFDTLEFRNAENGIEGLNIIKVWEPALVLTDWHMPEMNGLELIQELNRQMLGVKVGFITTETSQERQQQAFAAGASFFIQKPFVFEALQKTIKPLLDDYITSKIEKEEIEREKIEREATKKVELEKQRLAKESVPEKQETSIKLPHHDSLIEKLTSLLQPGVTLSVSNKLVLKDNHFPCLVSLFNDIKSNKLRVIGIMDHKSTYILGNKKNDRSPQNPIEMKDKKTINKETLQHCHHIMEEVSTTLSNKKNNDLLKLENVNILKKNSGTIEKLMTTTNEKRIDIEISVNGMGTGKITFLAS